MNIVIFRNIFPEKINKNYKKASNKKKEMINVKNTILQSVETKHLRDLAI